MLNLRKFVKFSQDLAYQKSLKSINFWQSYLKNKNVGVFGAQCSCIVPTAGGSTGNVCIYYVGLLKMPVFRRGLKVSVFSIFCDFYSDQVGSGVLRSVCLSVCLCLSASISLEPVDRSLRNVLCTSSVTVARSSSGGVALCYVVPVLWITSRLAVMGRMAMRGRLNS